LHQLGDGRFGAIGVKDKLANLYPDLDKRALYTTGLFKILTGNDSVTVDRKFKELVTFKNYAKLIFSANALPMTPDISYAFFRRWIILNFPNKFQGEKCDPFILDKITTKEEMSGLFNWAVLGLHELLSRKEFPSTKSVSETENEYLRLSCSTDAFVKECLIFEPASFISKSNLYEVYATWTEKHRLLIEEQRKLTSSLMKIIPKVRQAQPRNENGKPERGWQGVKLKDEIIEISDIDIDDMPVNPQQSLEVDRYDI
jgi:putative DNA primase/helicase